MRRGITLAKNCEQPERLSTPALASPSSRKALCRVNLELLCRLFPRNADRAGESAFRRFTIGQTRSPDDLPICTMRFGEEPALSALLHSGQFCIYCRERSIMATIVRHSLSKSHPHQGQIDGLPLLT